MVRDLVLNVSDARIVKASEYVDKIGLDCPLGWPGPFVALMTTHQSGHVTVAEGEGAQWRRRMAYRLTDEVVREKTGIVPLSVAPDRIAHTALRCAGLLAMLAADGQDVDRCGGGKIVEVYLAATLNWWGLTHRGYKGRSQQAHHADLVTTLSAAAPSLELGTFEALCRRSRPGGSDCKLGTEQQKRVAEMLNEGPVVPGADARWTLAGRRADRPAVRCRLHAARGVLSAAPGWLQPAGSRPAGGRTRPGGDRDVAAPAVAGGKGWQGQPAALHGAAARGAWICFQDEAGQTLRPPRSKTWARAYAVVTVSGKGSSRVSTAGLICLKRGHRGRLMWRLAAPRPFRRARRFQRGRLHCVPRPGPPAPAGADRAGLGQPQHPHQHADACPGRRPALADRNTTTGPRDRPKPCGGRLVLDETRHHQHRRPRRRPPRRPRQTAPTRLPAAD